MLFFIMILAILLYCLFIRIRYLSILIGLLLPIDLFGQVNPILLDALRYGMSIILLIKLKKYSKPRHVYAKIALILLMVIGSVTALRGFLYEDFSTIQRGIIGIVSVMFAYFLAINPNIRPSLFLGFVLGSVWSALDILCQVMGFPYLGLTSDLGVRFSGLSFTSTNTAPYLSIALVIIFMHQDLYRTKSRHRFAINLARVLAVGVLLLGLFFSGGRGGLAGLAVAILVWVVFRFRTKPLVATLGALSLLVLVVAGYDSLYSYITREGQNNSHGITTGRDKLNSESLNSFMNSPIFGVPIDERYLYRPHTPILSFALDAGIIGLLIGIALTFLSLRTVISIRNSHAYPLAYRMTASIMLLTIFLEPAGFFTGFTKTLLLMMTLSAFSENHHKRLVDTTLRSRIYSRTINDK